MRVGSLVATVESAAPGTSLEEMSMEPSFFANQPGVQHLLDLIASWLVAAKGRLATLAAEEVGQHIPSAWCQAPGALHTADPGRAADSLSWVQHGDLFPGNVYWDDQTRQLTFIDWDQCASGYSPLFDWFCLVSGLCYTHQRIRRLSNGYTLEQISFRQTYFEQSWFAEAILGRTQTICDRLGVERAQAIDYFRQYLSVRYHQFESRTRPQFAVIYREFYEFFLENREQCIFHTLER